MAETKTVKRVVVKPVEEKFVPPVAEVIPETISEPAVVEQMQEKVVEEKRTSVVPESRPTQIKWKLFYVGLLLLVLVVGFSGGLWWGYRQGWGITSSTPTPTPTPIVMAVPAPTPEVPMIVDRASITVDVFNATGVAGRAGTVANSIDGLGYGKGETGNAKAQTETTLELSADIASMSAVILSDIQTIVPETTLSTTTLTETGIVRLTLGSK